MRRRIALVALLALAAGCGGDPTAPEEPVRLTLWNSLNNTVTVSIDGTPQGGLNPTFLVPQDIWAPAGARSLQVTPVPRNFSDGTRVPDDYPTRAFAIEKGSMSVDVSNVVNGQPYFTPTITNTLAVPVAIGLVENGQVRCLCWVGEATAFSSSRVVLGYFRLSPSTEMRMYPGRTDCSGQFLVWSNGQLAAFAPSSGIVSLATR
jgi:hypothetical protein